MCLKKIVVLGPESTGKSTLCTSLASALRGVVVPEYAREYLDQLNRPYQEQDLLTIAQGQVRLEDERALEATSFLICDTDLHVIQVWSEYKYQRCDPWILEQIKSRKYDLHLLTDIDIDWIPDPLREHPQYEERKTLFKRYQELLQERRLPYFIVSGKNDKRLHSALQAIAKHFGEG